MKKKTIEIIKTEQKCVGRNDGKNCDRQCEKCDLVLPAPKIKFAYDITLSVLEKMLPKKIIVETENDRIYEDYICPHCKIILQQNPKAAKKAYIFKYDYCYKCGQAIDWSDADAEN